MSRDDNGWITPSAMAAGLETVLDGMTTAQLLSVPGVTELLLEELNNDVISMLTLMIEHDDEWDKLYVGSEDDGCYVQVDELPHGCGYQLTVTVDSATGSFVEDIVSFEYGHKTRADAQRRGLHAALEWCSVNDVEPNLTDECKTLLGYDTDDTESSS